jgi:beta-N-acetylhexosaminidase
MRKLYTLGILIHLNWIFVLSGFAQVELLSPEDRWVDSIFNEMSMEERIGQLFMIRAHSNLGQDHIESVADFISTYHVGGLCFFQGTAQRQVELTNFYQEISKRIPLMIAMDAEWGLAMRLKNSSIPFPRQLMLGAIQDNGLIYEFGSEVGRQLKRIGVHVNFAPVVDINNNPDNPVINDRSFGEDKYNVATKSYMYMRGLQDQRVSACAKHFPGHGDTNVDSHLELPVINHQKNRLDEIELFPFRSLANHGIQSIMVAHLNVPALDDRQNIPTTLSNKVINQLLKDELGFEGLVFTDGLEMRGVTKYFPEGELEVHALEAGNDVLLLPNNLPLAFQKVKESLINGRLSEEQIEESVKKILKFKYNLGLSVYAPVELNGLEEDLNRSSTMILKQKLIENALTLVRDEEDLVPVKDLSESLASVSFGSEGISEFQKSIKSYTEIPTFVSGYEMSHESAGKLMNKLVEVETVIVSLHNMKRFSQENFGLSPSCLDFIRKLSMQKKIILVVFGNPYSLSFFDHIESLIMAYEDDATVEEITAQALFGAIGFHGKLPVTASVKSVFGMGEYSPGFLRLGYTLPERVGMNPDSIAKADKIIEELITKRGAPGAQLLVARNSKIVYNKTYGYHTFAKKRPVQFSHIYDLASVTKIASGTLALMKLFDEGIIDLNEPLATYIPELKGTNKEDLILNDILIHQAGLIPWIPFYRETLKGNNKRPDNKYYRIVKEKDFSVEVSPGLYLRNDYVDSIWTKIIESDLRERRDYRYSDLGFYLVARLVENMSGRSIHEYVNKTFYEPLGMSKTMYNPLQQVPKNEIVPSEYDKYFRYDIIRGHVHDMGAAMLGGVSGHAGLFSSASDLCKVMQMLLNKGEYGGTRFLKVSTVEKFASRSPSSSRRGLGFDMKELNPHRHLNISEYASDRAFGHYGFTGTSVWMDPEYDLLIIFLCNRTFPSMDNDVLMKEDFRPRIQTAIYKSLMNSLDITRS